MTKSIISYTDKIFHQDWIHEMNTLFNDFPSIKEKYTLFIEVESKKHKNSIDDNNKEAVLNFLYQLPMRLNNAELAEIYSELKKKENYKLIKETLGLDKSKKTDSIILILKEGVSKEMDILLSKEEAN
jgi:hypothetical protein